MNRFRMFTLAVLGLAALVGTSRADFIQSFAYTDRGVYTGTFTRYTTLNDAQMIQVRRPPPANATMRM